MKRRISMWLVEATAVLAICAFTSAASAQRNPYALADRATTNSVTVPAATASARLRSVRVASTRTAPTPYYQTASSPNADQRIAALEETVAALKAKQAAAKKPLTKPSVTAGGRIHADWFSYSQDATSLAQSFGNQQNGFMFRRARLYLKGNAFDVVDYRAEFDLAGTQSTAAGDTLQAATYKDVYITVKELPVLGHLRFGHFKEPIGLDESTGANYITFIERSLTSAFTPAENVGVMAFDHSDSENMTWAVGAFINEIGDEPPTFRDDSGGTALAMRYTYLPWYDEATDGRGYLHTGISYSYRDVADETVRFRRRPDTALGSFVVDTGDITAVPDTQLLGIEAAYVRGPFSIQSEVLNTYVNRRANTNATFSGSYVYMSYFLTGEHRPYDRAYGKMGRVKPFENFFRVRDENCQIQNGKGAWELGYRYSYLNLDHAGIAGGTMGNHTFGVNWYLNPYTRLMWNYINSDAGPAGTMDIFAMRAAIDF